MRTDARPRVLVVDDDDQVRELLVEVLSREPLDVRQAADGRAALDVVLAERPAVILCDITMPGLNGLELLQRVRTLAPEVPVVMLTAIGDVATAVKAMRLGAHDYLTKPFDTEDVVVHVRRALEHHLLQSEVEALKTQLAETGSLRELMGRSAAVQDVVERVAQVAPSKFSVLVQGETGSGKEVVARAIHRQSARRDAPFVAVDCGAIPETLIESELFGYEKGAFTGADRRREGHFQLAANGTLFLDEIGNLSAATQSKLLRVLQERQIWALGARAPIEIDVRIVAATNASLDVEVAAGRFRQDLFYRLNEFLIVLPPLRARREDILSLARRFVAEASLELGRPARAISAEAATLLLSHGWPGNVRELRNVMRRAALVAADVVRPEDLTFHGTPPAALAPDEAAEPPRLTLKEARDRAIEEAERLAITRALREARGNKSEAARALKTDYKTLHVKLKLYGL